MLERECATVTRVSDRDVGGGEEPLLTYGRHEQRLGRSQTAASVGAGATGLVGSAHRSFHRRPVGNGQRLFQSGRHLGARSGRTAAGLASKTSHHRSRRATSVSSTANQRRAPSEPHGTSVPLVTRSADPKTENARNASELRYRLRSRSSCEPNQRLVSESSAIRPRYSSVAPMGRSGC